MWTATTNKTIEGSQAAEEWLEQHSQTAPRLRCILERYYQTHGRDLPWRRTRDPYKVLVAEMLLQKTGYKPVEKVWLAFIQQYPHVRALANAPMGDLEALIQPLGMHRRAARLQEIARRIVCQTDGEIIADQNFLRSLPGVGDYTAAAVLSYALDVKALAVDVNAARVLARIGGFAANTLRQELAFAKAVGELLLTQETHRAVNYGLLDVSAQICRPQPHCEICPASDLCEFAQAAED